MHMNSSSSVIFIALDQELTADEHIRNKLGNGLIRAQRQASRFSDLDLPAMQEQVHQALATVQLKMDGVYMGLLDLINAARNGGKAPDITPGNARNYLSMANMVTLNGIYFYQLLQDNGYDPVIIQNYSLERDRLHERLAEKPLAVAISSNFLYLDDIKDMALACKAQAPETAVIAGGALVKKVLNAGQKLGASTRKWLNGFYGAIDSFVVESQGERTFLEALDKARAGAGWAGTPNLAYFNGGTELLFSERDEEPVNMDGSAIRWDRIPAQYLRKTVPVNTSRGCLYKCRFCTYRNLMPGIHYKSIDTLRDELRQVERLGFVNHVRFTDDNFTANAQRIKNVLRMMIQEDFSFSWSSFARSDAITPEVAELMRDSKCDFLDMGIESGSPAILAAMDKRLTVDKIKSAIDLLNRHGIYGAGAFIVGFPGETEETVRETVDLINSSGLPFYHLNLFYYSSGMLAHTQRDEYGLRGLGLVWKHKTMDSVTASKIISEMVDRIPHSYTDGITSTWETFKILRGEGLSAPQIQELYTIKRTIEKLSDGENVLSEKPEVRKLLEQIRRVCDA